MFMKKILSIKRDDLKVGTRIMYASILGNELVWEISAIHPTGYDIDTGRLYEDVEYDVIPVLNNPRTRKRIGLTLLDINRYYVLMATSS